MGGGSSNAVTEGTVRKVELLSYGNIPGYYPPLLNTGSETKKQKISVLTDYQVTGLVPSSSPHPSISGVQTHYNKEIYIPNRRKALVAIELTSKGMDNCQSLIGKLLKHPNVTQIAFQGYRSDFRYRSYTYLCRGVYGNDTKFIAPGRAIPSFPKHFFAQNIGYGNLRHYSLNILGKQLPILYVTTSLIERNQRYDPTISLFKQFGFNTYKLEGKVMVINYNF